LKEGGDDDELGRTWEEVVITCFKVLSQHLPGRTEENHCNQINIFSEQQ
jgi:hypothetical protein